MDFYSSLAPEYDRMTRFDDRMQTESALLSKWVDPAKERSVLDAACGTGLHAILLAKMGIRVVGMDLSPEMTMQAGVNAKKAGVHVDFITGDMRCLGKELLAGFDAILCLGNTLPHLLKLKDLEKTFKGFFRLLNPGGFVLLQILNYDKILKKKERIIGIHRKEGREFIRFNDFAGRFVDFNILTVTENQGKLDHTFNTTRLYPYKKRELAGALKKTGFWGMELFGNMEKTAFDPVTSPNLVIRAKK